MAANQSEGTWLPARDYEDFHRMSVTRFVESVAPTLPAGAVIVDAGAGEAWYKPLFVRARYLALDYAVGDRTWDYSRLDCVCDLHAMPLKTDSVPFVLCTQTLEHVQRPQVVLSELNRILRPGGTVFCSLPFIGDAHHQEPYDFFRYTRYGVEYLFKSACFADVQITPIGGYNTLLVSLVQKGVYRCMERLTGRPWFVRIPLRYALRLLLMVMRWANKLAWGRDRKNPDRYRYAMGFTVIARK